MFGSSRIGIANKLAVSPVDIPFSEDSDLGMTISTFTRGEKNYELSNHLGNVLVTITDKKIRYSASIDDYYGADVVSAVDYFPFGMTMPGRSYSSDGYRYGFNGKEKDKDMNSLTAYDYGFRIYNPAIGKFLSVDPLTRSYPMLTPYQYASNRPIDGVDLDGLEYLSSNSSMYSMAYSSSPYLNPINGKTLMNEIYYVKIVYHNIPNALKDPARQDFKFTSGGPVGAYGQDQNLDNEIYRKERYYQEGPSFQGANIENIPIRKGPLPAPSATAPNQGTYSFSPDQANNSSTAANAAAQSRWSARANAGREASGIVSNLINTSTWNAMADETRNRQILYFVTNNITSMIEAGKFDGYLKLKTGDGKVNLINFMVDGSLPTGNMKASDMTQAQLTHNIEVAGVGINLLEQWKKSDDRIGGIKSNVEKLYGEMIFEKSKRFIQSIINAASKVSKSKKE